MSKLAAGTPDPLKSAYTLEQLAALEPMKDPKYALGIARTEFVNKALAPDGTLFDGRDVLDQARVTLDALLAQPTRTAASLAAATEQARLIEEIDTHGNAQRFLFIVDADYKPVIYFQCVTPTNPDLPPLVDSLPAEAQ